MQEINRKQNKNKRMKRLLGFSFSFENEKSEKSYQLSSLIPFYCFYEKQVHIMSNLLWPFSKQVMWHTKIQINTREMYDSNKLLHRC